MRKNGKMKVGQRARIALIALIVFSIAITQLISLGSIDKNVARRALVEVKDTAQEQAADVKHNLSLQFDILESLAAYMSKYDDFNFAEQKELMYSVLTTNRFCAVAYTDKNGNILGAVSADKAVPSGNVADRQYFIDATYWKDAHVVQYMQKTALTDDSRVIFAVPVVRKSAVDGVVFASTEQDFFEDKLWSNNAANQNEAFLIDSTGMILADMADTGLFQNGVNLFETFISGNEAEQMKADLSTSANGDITVSAQNNFYVAYSYTGVNDWFVVSLIDNAAATDRYAQNINHIKRIVWSISAVFVVCAIALFFLYESFEKRRKNVISILENTSRKLAIFLEKSGNASFEFDARSATLYASENLEKLLGYKLPKNWFSIINERAQLHPEFDYEAVVGAYNNILLTGGYKETVTAIRLEGKGLRWLKISMTAATNEHGLVYGIVGVLSDITESYVEERIGKEELEYIMEETLSLIPMSISVNLSKNTYSMISHVPSFAKNLPWKGKYDELVHQLQYLMPENYRRQYFDTFCTDKLLNDYEDGKTSVEMEHQLSSSRADEGKWVLSRANFIKNRASDDICLLILVIDISAQKERALLLQRSYDMTIDNMPGFACKWLFDGNDVLLLSANAAFYHFIKAPEEMICGHSVIYNLNLANKRDVLNGFYAKARDKQEIHYTGQGYKYDGEAFWVTINGTYFSEQDGKPIYLCAISDITNIVRISDSMSAKNEEFKTAAEMSNAIVLRYDIVNRKINVMSNGGIYDQISELDGHDPEYAIEKGIMPIVEGASFYNTFMAIEKGTTEGEIRFAVKKGETSSWVTGRYKTLFDDDGNPVSAIIILNAEKGKSDNTNAKMLTDFYERADESSKKVMVVNLTEDIIEFESESDDYQLAQDEAFVFSKAKQQMVEDGKIVKEYCESWLDFLDNSRLINLYKNGVNMGSMRYIGNTQLGAGRKMEVEFMLQESQYDGSIRAYIVLKDKLADNETKASAATSGTPDDTVRNITIRTFGYFDIYVNGRPVSFAHDKSKEMLAVLVDRRGGFVSSSDMIAHLWEDEEFNRTTQSRCRQVASRLKKTLGEYGIGDIIETINGRRRIIPEKVDCDYFNYLENKPEYRHLYTGSYMLNYSWSEITTADLENSKSII